LLGTSARYEERTRDTRTSQRALRRQTQETAPVILEPALKQDPNHGADNNGEVLRINNANEYLTGKVPLKNESGIVLLSAFEGVP
jgi:hypothetical protein